jgi:hypothetical protein
MADKKMVVEILGNASSLKKTFDDVKKEFEKFRKQVEKNGIDIQRVSKFAMAAGGTVVAAFTAMTLAAAKIAGEMDDLTKRAGVNSESFQKLSYAAKLNGVEMTSLSGGLIKLSKTLYDANENGKKSSTVFQELGINVVDNNGKLRQSDQVLLDVATKFKGMTNETEKVALAQKLFGKSGAELLPLLNQGKEGILAFGDEAKRLGLILSDEAITALTSLDDSVDKIKSGFGGLGNQIGAAFAPILNKLADGLAWVIELFNKIPAPVRNAGIIAIGLAAAVALLGGAFLAALPSIIATMAALWPLTAAAAAVGAIAYLVVNNWTVVKTFLEVALSRAINVAQIYFSNFKIFVLAQLYALVKALEMLFGWVPGVGEKLRDAVKWTGDAIRDETENIKKNTKELTSDLKGQWDEHYKKNKAEEKKRNEEKKKENQKTNTEITEQQKRAYEERLKLQKEWSDKLYELTHSERERLIKEAVEALQNDKLTQDARWNLMHYYALKLKELDEKEAQERLNRLKEWDQKIFDETHNDLEKLNREEENAVTAAGVTEEEKLKIREYYAVKRRALLDQMAAAEKQRTAELETQLYNLTHSELEIRFRDLEIEKQKELTVVGLSAEQKLLIEEIYAKKRQQINEDVSDAINRRIEEDAEKARQAYENMLSQIADAVSKIEAISKIWYDNDMKRLEMKTEKEKEEAKKKYDQGLLTKEEYDAAIAAIDETADKKKRKMERDQAIRDKNYAMFKIAIDGARAAIAALPNIALSILIGALAAAELVAVSNRPIPALAKGAKLTGPTVMMAGEVPGESEYVVPGNPQVFREIGRGIQEANQYNSTINNSSSREINLNIGTLVADKQGLKALERTLNDIRIEENERRGNDG